MLPPESAVSPVWPYGAIRPVEVSRLASACRAFSLSGLPRVGVGADRHGVCGHPHRCHHTYAGQRPGGRHEYPGHRTAVERGQRHRESLAARLGGTVSTSCSISFVIYIRECQLDELWTFIAKKEARLTSLEKLAAIAGDAWVWIAFSPVNKLVLAWVGGASSALRDSWLPSLNQRPMTISPSLPVMPCPTMPKPCGGVVWMTPPRQGTRGRFPHPRRCPPPDLCYAIVVKERKHGRVIHVTTRVVYGTIAQVEAALQVSPVSRTINTYGVERNNLTVRQHARRLGRKVNAFSKEPDSRASAHSGLGLLSLRSPSPQFTATPRSTASSTKGRKSRKSEASDPSPWPLD